MAKGNLALQNIYYPGTIDLEVLQRYQTVDGVTGDAIVSEFDQAIAVFNQSFASNLFPEWTSISPEPDVYYEEGDFGRFEESSEYTQPTPQYVDATGHMIPIKEYDRQLRWTRKYLENATMEQLRQNMRAIFKAAINGARGHILQRFFKVENEVVGTNGVSPGWANGGSPTFTPPTAPDYGGSFSSTHTHYLRLNGITPTNLAAATKHLWEHGIIGPYDLIVSEADLATWTNTTTFPTFLPTPDPLVQFGIAENRARLTDTEKYAGIITTPHGTVRVMSLSRIPTNYWGVTKSYGQNDPQNPLRIRSDKKYGLGLRLVAQNIALYPLDGMIPLMNYGVGVKNRLGGVAVYNNSTGDYVTPTIN